MLGKTLEMGGCIKKLKNLKKFKKSVAFLLWFWYIISAFERAQAKRGSL